MAILNLHWWHTARYENNCQSGTVNKHIDFLLFVGARIYYRSMGLRARGDTPMQRTCDRTSLKYQCLLSEVTAMGLRYRSQQKGGSGGVWVLIRRFIFIVVQALDRDPTNAKACYRIGQACLENGDYDQGLEFIRHGLQVCISVCILLSFSCLHWHHIALDITWGCWSKKHAG